MSGELKLLPCPFCGGAANGDVVEGSTFRWRMVLGCCVAGPEVRFNTMADDCVAAEEDCRQRAIAAWNDRAPIPTPAPGALPELPEAENPADDEFVDGLNVYPAHPDYYTADQMHAYARAYAEQCRAGVDRSKEVFSFESWAIAQGFHPDDFDRIEGRPANKFGLTWEYNGNFLQASWAAWMERAALQSAFDGDEGVKK